MFSPDAYAALLFFQALDSPSVNNLQARIGRVHFLAAKAQIDHRLPGANDHTPTQVLHQVGALLDLRGQGMPVIRVASKAASAHHQTLLVGHRDADFDTE